jgi:hypothetical protein
MGFAGSRGLWICWGGADLAGRLPASLPLAGRHFAASEQQVPIRLLPSGRSLRAGSLRLRRFGMTTLNKYGDAGREIGANLGFPVK